MDEKPTTKISEEVEAQVLVQVGAKDEPRTRSKPLFSRTPQVDYIRTSSSLPNAGDPHSGCIVIEEVFHDLDLCVSTFLNEYVLGPKSENSQSVGLVEFVDVFTRVTRTVALHQMAPRTKDRPSLMGVMVAYCISRFLFVRNIFVRNVDGVNIDVKSNNNNDNDNDIKHKAKNNKNNNVDRVNIAKENIANNNNTDAVRCTLLMLLFCIYWTQPVVTAGRGSLTPLGRVPIRLTLDEYLAIVNFLNDRVLLRKDTKESAINLIDVAYVATQTLWGAPHPESTTTGNHPLVEISYPSATDIIPTHLT